MFFIKESLNSFEAILFKNLKIKKKENITKKTSLVYQIIIYAELKLILNWTF